MQYKLFDQPDRTQLLADLFNAYYDARKNKRNKKGQLLFEWHYEKELIRLSEEIFSGTYCILPNTCFIINEPVKREIFAADFRDRVVHHLVYNYIAPVFEKTFIYDSYSCRKNKGTHLGIKRIDHFIRSCSRNYHVDCFILKLDIKGYFMAIDHEILYNKIEKQLRTSQNRAGFESELVLRLIKNIIFHDVKKGCIIKGKLSDWSGLPLSKSLFNTGQGKGLPIGNLTSQLFANIYLNGFDHFVKRILKIKYYGRYVDDFILIHEDKEYLKLCIGKIATYLMDNLKLELHPDKIYLQHYTKGVKYLGAIIKPYRIYISSRTKNNFIKAVNCSLQFYESNNHPDNEQVSASLVTFNSYLGMMKHWKTFSLRQKYYKLMKTSKMSEYLESEYPYYKMVKKKD